MELTTPKGFRDFLPADARKRQFVQDVLKNTFGKYGFQPLETPAIEYSEVLKGKYGEEEKLIYTFKDRGGRELALRYDQTVPLARVISQYPTLPKPFKRYQIQNVWRAENTQKGRYREFIQCDADIIGSSTPLADSEILALVLAIYERLDLQVTIKINDRANFQNLDKKYVTVIDKLEKIGESAVLAEMVSKGLSDTDAKKALRTLQDSPITSNLQEILDNLKKMGVDTSRIKYEPTLARGLDYYTGMIFETVAEGSSGSICSGGRWDKMIGQFTGTDQPSVGFGLGFDRTIEVMESQDLFQALAFPNQVLVTVFNPELLPQSLELVKKLRDSDINSEVYLDPMVKLEKQLKYADLRKINFIVIIGPEEVERGLFTVKDLNSKQQKLVSLDELLAFIR